MSIKLNMLKLIVRVVNAVWVVPFIAAIISLLGEFFPFLKLNGYILFVIFMICWLFMYYRISVEIFTIFDKLFEFMIYTDKLSKFAEYVCNRFKELVILNKLPEGSEHMYLDSFNFWSKLHEDLKHVKSKLHLLLKLDSQAIKLLTLLKQGDDNYEKVD